MGGSGRRLALLLYGNLLVGFFVSLCGFGADSERVSLSGRYYTMPMNTPKVDGESNYLLYGVQNLTSTMSHVVAIKYQCDPLAR